MSANAERAADDPSAIAYLGELDLGASAVSVPVTNDAGLLQVSPTDGLTSLTQTPPAARAPAPSATTPPARGASLRLVPNDDLLAETLLELDAPGRRPRGWLCSSTPDVYSRELAGAAGRPRPRATDLRRCDFEEYRGDVEEIPDVARRLAEGRPDAVVYAGDRGPAAPAGCWPRSTRACRGCPCYATAGCWRAIRPPRSRRRPRRVRGARRRCRRDAS